MLIYKFKVVSQHQTKIYCSFFSNLTGGNDLASLLPVFTCYLVKKVKCSKTFQILSLFWGVKQTVSDLTVAVLKDVLRDILLDLAGERWGGQKF